MTNTITVQIKVSAPIAKVWQCWTDPAHIPGWAFASDDWEARPKENNLAEGGRFNILMTTKDQSVGFDFEGTYTVVNEPQQLEYDLTDGRHVKVDFIETNGAVQVVQTFEPDQETPEDLQRDGWQAFLNNFRKYVETTSTDLSAD